MNTLKTNAIEIFNPTFDCHNALTRAALTGYAFCSNAISAEACEAMEEEVSRLPLQAGDYVTKPINEYKSTRVTQSHERAYLAIGNVQVPVATLICSALVRRVGEIASQVSATDDPLGNLVKWVPTEAGYQRYRNSTDHISPHRDRRTDQLLGATITINGSALVRIHEPLDHPDDYSRLKVVDSFETIPGGIMFLRAFGFAGGGQVIHEVIPPTTGNRLILNLRMRHDILKNPEEI